VCQAVVSLSFCDVRWLRRQWSGVNERDIKRRAEVLFGGKLACVGVTRVKFRAVVNRSVRL
jgi:hypothetical protein